MSTTIIIEPRAATIETEVDDMGRLRVVPDQVLSLGGGGLRSFGPSRDYFRAVLGTQAASLIGYWPLNEASGTVAADYSGNTRNGSYEGSLTLGQTGIGDGRTAVLGVAGAVKLHSASYAAAFNGAEGTLIAWLKVADLAHWADGIDQYVANIFATAGQIYFRKYPSANSLQFSYAAGGVTESLLVSRYETRWIQLAITWSKTAESVTFYVNGSVAGTSATLGVWSGTLSANLNCFGALRNDNFASPFKGYFAHGALWSKALTGPEIKNLHDQAVPTTGVFVLGDSKSGDSYPWWRYACDTLATDAQAYEMRPGRYYTAGWKVADLKTYVAANLAAEWTLANKAWINIGANDLSAGTSEASFKADLTSVIDALQAKYPAIVIYVARPWIRGKNTEASAMKTWIAAVVATYASGVAVGPDETVWLENGDNGVTYTTDGTHYNAAGITAAAAQWAALG